MNNKKGLSNTIMLLEEDCDLVKDMMQ